MSLYILLLVCSNFEKECNINTARFMKTFVAPPGIIVCGVPATMPVINTAAGPDQDEYIKIRCELRRR